MSRLKDFYREEVVKQLQEQFGYKSVMEVPRITKITLNMGVGEALTDKKGPRKCSFGHGSYFRSESCGYESP